MTENHEDLAETAAHFEGTGPGDDVASTTSPPAKKREHSDIERAAMQRLAAHRERVPKVELLPRDDAVAVSVSMHDREAGEALLLQSFGARDRGFVDTLVTQLIDLNSSGSEPDTESATFMLSIVRDIEPRDQVEAMLGAQMAAVHLATMTMAKRLKSAELLPQQDSAERAFNKLSRTFTTQMEALKRYRTGGEQKVTVQHQHVTVEDGGQAVVGTVNNPGGRGKP